MLEVEVKFYVGEMPAFRQTLLTHNPTLHKPHIFERNVCYDNAWGGLKQAGELLRVRKDAGIRLTFKGLPPEPIQSEAKVREEIEVSVDDFDKMTLILERIGFQPTQTYEKYRETFLLGDVEIVLDELPYGNFVELEGTEPAIRSLAHQLGLDWNTRILDNYLLMLANLNSHHNLTINDLTFANFADLDVTVADILGLTGY